MALICSACNSGDCSAVGGDKVSCFGCGKTVPAVPHTQAPDNPPVETPAPDEGLAVEETAGEVTVEATPTVEDE